MRVSTRSWILLVGSIPAPVTIASLRFASLDQRRAIARETKRILGFDPGLIPMMLFLLGIACFGAFLGSIVVDYFRSRIKKHV